MPVDNPVAGLPVGPWPGRAGGMALCGPAPIVSGQDGAGVGTAPGLIQGQRGRQLGGNQEEQVITAPTCSFPGTFQGLFRDFLRTFQ